MLEIIQSDCVEYLKTMSDKTIDVVVTSPPYNIGKVYNGYKDKLSQENYLEWISTVGIELKRVMKDDASLFVNIGGTSKNPFVAMDVCYVLRKQFELQNNIIWVKSITVAGKVYMGDDYDLVESEVEEISQGHFKPINSPRYLNNLHESIFHFSKNGNVNLDRMSIGVSFMDKYNTKRYNGKWKEEYGNIFKDKRCRGNVWYIPYETYGQGIEKIGHPAIFPISLVENCIKLHGIKDNMNVLDPFLGSGTTLVVCKKLKINGVGIESDVNYCNIASERLKD